MASTIQAIYDKASRGDIEEQYIYGLMLEQGNMTTTDVLSACDWFSKAASQGHEKAQAELKRIVESLEALAKTGDLDAQCNLGYMIEHGYWVKMDPKKAFKIYETLALSGHSMGQYNLGMMYHFGIVGVSVNRIKALDLFNKAQRAGNGLALVMLRSLRVQLQNSAEKGDPKAQCNLGYMYAHGIQVHLDLKRAFELFKSSALQGNAEAQYRLGVYFFEKRDDRSKDQDPLPPIEKRKNPAKSQYPRDYLEIDNPLNQAIFWFEKAAHQEHAEAQYSLGLMYEEGIGVNQDHAIAMDWYRNAVENSHTIAHARLSELEARINTKKAMAVNTFIEAERLRQEDVFQEKLKLNIMARAIFLKPILIHRVISSGNTEAVKTILRILLQSDGKQFFDLKAVSFIHLKDLCATISKKFEDHQDRLRKQGAIFTLMELENDIEAYLQADRSEIESQVGVRLHGNIKCILEQWRKGRLHNADMAKRFDQDSVLQLKNVLWPNNTSYLLDDCQPMELAQTALATLKHIKQLEAQYWFRYAIPFLEGDTEKYLMGELCAYQWEFGFTQKKDASLGNSKALLMSFLKSYQNAIFYRKLKQSKIPQEFLTCMEESILKKLQIFTQPGFQIERSDPLFALYELFKEDRFLKVENHKFNFIVKMDEIHHETLRGIIKKWRENKCTPEQEQSMRAIVDSLPRIEMLGTLSHEFLTHIVNETAFEFLTDCKQYRKLDLESQAIDLKVDADLKENTERGEIKNSDFLKLRTVLVSIMTDHCQVTESQKIKVCQRVLEDWKQYRLASNVQRLLDSTLIHRWLSYMQKLSLKNNIWISDPKRMEMVLKLKADMLEASKKVQPKIQPKAQPSALILSKPVVDKTVKSDDMGDDSVEELSGSETLGISSLGGSFVILKK